MPAHLMSAYKDFYWSMISLLIVNVMFLNFYKITYFYI